MKLPKIKPDAMILATFFTSIFYSATYPYIHKELMQVVSETLLACTQIINCVSIVLFGLLWNKTSRLFKYYPALCILEILTTVTSSLIVTLTGNIIAYYIMDTLLFSIVTRNIICGGTKLRSLRYNTETAREHYDNNNLSADAIATIIGSVIAMVLHLNFIAMLWLATVGNAVDNIFYIAVYLKTTKRKTRKE